MQLNRCIRINKSWQDITFKSGHFEAVKICANDTLLCDDFNASPIYESLYGGNPILHIGEDSTIELSSENDARWPLNRLCTQIGKHEWMFSYIIDSKWIADAWAETQSNE